MTDALRHPVHLALVQARFQLVEAIRTPISILMGLLAPSIGLLFFVVPQRSVAEDPVRATLAVAGLAVFGLMVNALFQFAIEVSQARERPWGAYTRTLPSGPLPRLLSYFLSSGALAVASVVPLVGLAAVTTSASLPAANLLAGVAALLATAIPFMLLGIAIGYTMSSKAAVAVSQVLMLLLAFGGGLFIPAEAFPPLLDAVSLALPTRSSIELVSWAVGAGTDHIAASIIGWVGWTLGMALFCLYLARRDADREYRS